MDLFEELFKIYPPKRKGTRRMAYPKWLAAIKREDPEVILAGAKAYAASNPGEYAKNLPSWLHNDMWSWDWTPEPVKVDPAMQKARYFDLKKRYAKPYHDWMSEEEIAEFKRLEKA